MGVRSILNKVNRAANEPRFCDMLNLSAGRDRSFNPAATRHHFIIGAQKKTVLGPGKSRMGELRDEYHELAYLRGGS